MIIVEISPPPASLLVVTFVLALNDHSNLLEAFFLSTATTAADS